MFRNTLIISLFSLTLSFTTGCLTDETDTIDPDPSTEIAAPTPSPSDDGSTDDNGCHLRRNDGELECQDPQE
jgi:hypothetical protein